VALTLHDTMTYRQGVGGIPVSAHNDATTGGL
jgi:hypothetical protein